MAVKKKKYLTLLDRLDNQQNLTVVKEDDKPVTQTVENMGGRVRLKTDTLNVGAKPTKTNYTTSTKKEEDKAWYQEFFKESESDNALETTLHSTADVILNIGNAIGNTIEGVIDLPMHIDAGINKGLGWLSEKTGDLTENVFGEDNVISKILHSTAEAQYAEAEKVKSWVNYEAVNSVMKEPMEYFDKNSIFGDTSDAVAKAIGQTLTFQLGGGLLGKAGNIPVLVGKLKLNIPTTALLSGTGSGISEAYNSNENIKDWQAWLKGTGAGTIEGIAEGLFGMFNIGGSSLDDALVNSVTKHMKTGLTKALVKVPLKSAGEGVEEIVSYAGNYILDHGIDLMSQITGDTEVKLGKEWNNADMWESFFTAMLSSMIMQGAGTTIDINQAQNNAIKEAEKQLGRQLTNDEKSSLKKQISLQLMQSEENEITMDEQKVVNSVVENKVAEQGKTLSTAELNAIRNQVVSDLKKGYISTTDIENTLLAKDNAEITALHERLAAETDPKARADIETLINLNEINKQTNLENLLKDNQLLQESYNEQARKSEAFTYDNSQELSEQRKSLYTDAQELKLDNTNRTHETLDMIANIAEDRGTKYRIVNSAKLKELGFIETANGLVTNEGEVLINIESKKALNAVVGHETTHLLEGSEDSEALQKFAMEYAKAKGEYDTRLATINKLYQGTNANVYNELTADIVGDYLFTDEQFINNLSTEKPNIFKRIYNYIKHVYKMATAGSTEARQLEQLKYKFEQAYKNTAKQANTDTKYSLGSDIQEKHTKNYWQDISGKPANRTEFSNENGRLVVMERGDGVNAIYETYVKPESRNQGLGTKLLNRAINKYKDTNLVGQFSSEQSVKNAYKLGFRTEDNATLEETLVRQKEDSSVYMEYQNNTKYSLTDNQNRKLSKEQQEYFKDSKVRDENGNLLTVYHSSPNKFTEFDRSKLGENTITYGNTKFGHFVTPSKQFSERFTDIDDTGATGYTMELYANITNPITHPYNAHLKYSGAELDNIVRNYYEAVDNQAAIKVIEDTMIEEELDSFYEAYRFIADDFVTDPFENAKAEREILIKKGYDGVEIVEGIERNLIENSDSDNVIVSYAVFESNQLKNTDNVKPTTHPDVRYSLTDDAGKTLTKGQQEYFKDSKVRDEQGRLIKVYHGTEYPGFTEFSHEDPSIGNYRYGGKNVNFFTSNVEMAASYSHSPFASRVKTPKLSTMEEVHNAIAEKNNELYEANKFYDAEYRLANRLTIREENGVINLYDEDKIMHTFKNETDIIRNINSVLRSLYGGGEFSYTEGIYAGYVNITNPYIVDAKGKSWKFIDGNLTTNDIVKKAIADGSYDGVIIKNVVDYGGESLTEKPGDLYVTINDSNQFKNEDNLNPTKDPDIRYSLTPDYGMRHRPSTDYGDASNFEENMPDVFEHPEWYRFGGDEWYKKAYYESLNALRKVRGNPDGEITIYRATIGDGFNEGDWVSPSKTYAENHNYANLDGKGKVIELKVKAKDIRFAGDDLNEFGYFPNGVDDYSLSEPDIAPTGSYNVYGKDLKQQVEEAIAPLQETITELTEQVETLQEQLAPVEQKVAKTEPETVQKVAKTMQAEIENLIDLRDNSSGSEYAMAFFELKKKYGAKNFYKALNNFYSGTPVETGLQEDIPTTGPINVMEKDYTPDALTDEDIAPIAEDTTPEVEDVDTGIVESPFEERDIDEVGKRNVKAYQYENPEVKPFFREMAGYMLNDLNNTIKGERTFNSQAYYDTNGEAGWYGTERQTTDDIAYLKDSFGYTYAQIEEGLKKIIEDDGKENNAVSKRIEFMLDERLRNGYEDISGTPIPANQDYINLLAGKQITEYHSNRYANMTDEEIMRNLFQFSDTDTLAEETTPDIPKIQKPSKTPIKEEYEAIEPKDTHGYSMKRIKTDAEQQAEQKKQIAKVLVEEEPTVNNRNKRKAAIIAANVLDKGLVFENLALKKGNRDLQGKWDYTLTSEARAQHVIGNGHTKRGIKKTKSLNEIRSRVESTGYTQPFYDYMYHKLNIDRMTLEERFARSNKPVFGDDVTAEQSREIVAQYEAAFPEFIEWAEDVYDYVNADRQQLVDNGVISQETADYWSNMYPHYVPIRRVGKTANAINVPLDTGRTGINAPIKKATGGSADILPLFDTMALRTLQTYKATAKNSFGLELMHTMDPIAERRTADIDEVIESVEAQEELLQKGENGRNPTFTVFENGERITFEITEDMYDALKPISDSSILSKTFKIPNTANNIRRGLLTEYNPVFMLTNALKDAQDVLINSQHATKTYATIPEAYAQIMTKGYWYQEYIENGGQQNSYFDSQENTFDTERKGIAKVLDFYPIRKISEINNVIEMAPRLAEYIASRETGRNIETSMLDASRVSTNFKAGGALTKFLNRNGFTFLNASVQGAMQQVRNVREANANGIKGWANLATKFILAGLPAMILNGLIWDDDEEYEELSDYVKQNYYIVGKNEDGTFIRIPKGRTTAVIQEAFNQMGNLITGDDEVDLKNFLDLVVNNLAPNNPLENNIASPIVQAIQNKAWYGGDLVPKRLQDLPAAEQYDESTDEFSKWLGELINVSPYKINYVLDQYSGGIGDIVLPMLTPEAENGSDSVLGDLLAPLNDKFTTNSTLNNQNISDFYDLSDELTTGAKKSNATDADVLMNKYVNSVKSELNELYKQKREIQSSDLSDGEKYQQVLDVQRQINELAKEALGGYENVNVQENYAKVEDREYRINNSGEWTKITDDQLEKQYKVMNNLGIDANSYWGNKEEYDFAYENPERYAVATAIGGYETYKGYSSDLYDLKADKDENGKSINGSRKEKVIDYVNNLDIDYGQKIILFKSEYNADDTYNQDIIDYLNEREDISYEQMATILKELGFEVDSNGNIYWD